MLFITAQQLPSFITWDKSRTPGYNWLWLPRLKPRHVPISQYLLQVTTFASGTLLNNIVFAFNVPPTLQIVFRSAGNCRAFFFSLSPLPPSPSRLSLLLLVYYIIVESAVLRAELLLWTGLAVSMLLGRFFMGKRYTLKQTVPHLLLSLSLTTGHRHAC
jgi:UAA transporter family